MTAPPSRLGAVLARYPDFRRSFPEMLARANATWRTLVYGMQPAGALLGGLLATALGLRADLLIGSAVMFAGTAVAVASPLRGPRELPPLPELSERLAA